VIESKEIQAKLTDSVFLTAELERKNLALLNVHQIHTLRGTLDYVLKDGKLSEQAINLSHAIRVLKKYDMTAGRAKTALACANADVKVVSDNAGQPHTYTSLATKIMGIRTRMQSGMHIERSPGAVRAGGTAVLIRQEGGLTESEVTVLACLLRACHYPVHVEYTPLVGPQQGKGVETT